MNCCDREALDWAGCKGDYDSDTMQDVMVRAVERHFGSQLPLHPIEWLTDNGVAYRAGETREFAGLLG